MTPKIPGFLVVACALVALAATPLGACAAERQTHPNIICVIVDQLRYQSCGYAGELQARTPDIDKLAAAGVTFRQAVSSTPVCSAYRASLFTGKYTSSTGMVINELRMNTHHAFRAQSLTRAG
jgi:arylsulfatase A-like enzyme